MTIARVSLGLVAVIAVTWAVGAAIAPAPVVPGPGALRVGLVFDVGGKNDRSFNEAAWRGLEQARADLGVHTRFVEPSGAADREAALRELAASGQAMVIGVGFIFSADLERIAVQFPAVKFAGVDYAPTGPASTPPNLVGLRFREHEGSFVVGAIAGWMSRTGVVGFVGGMQIPLIRKFEAGFAAGVRHACPRCTVLAAYAGTEPKAFADPTLGQQLASAQYDRGADIIYHEAGKTGDGVFAAAKSRRRWAIGVDSDQFANAPCCVVTSMLKRVDVAVVDVIRRVQAGQFVGGIVELGLRERGIDFVTGAEAAPRLPPEITARARRLEADIVAGTIVVPSE